MPKQSTRRFVLTATLASLAALIVIGMTSSFLLTPSSQQEPKTIRTVSSPGILAGPDEFVQEGGRSAVVVEATQEKIELKRGESTTLTFNISHRTAADGFEVIHVAPKEFQGAMLLPSVLESTTIQERAELAMQGKPIPGSIDKSSLVQFSDTNIELRAGETKTIEVTISLPASLPDEIVGKSIHFAPKLAIQEVANASPDDGTRALVFSDMTVISVVA